MTTFSATERRGVYGGSTFKECRKASGMERKQRKMNGDYAKNLSSPLCFQRSRFCAPARIHHTSNRRGYPSPSRRVIRKISYSEDGQKWKLSAHRKCRRPPKVTPAGRPRKACNDAGLRIYTATCDSQMGTNRPPVTPAGEIPQTRFPPRVAGRCDPAGGRLRPPAFILHDFRPLGSPAHFGFRAIPVPAAHSPPHRALWCGSVCSCPCRNRRTQRPTGGHVPAWAAVVR